MTDKKKDRPFVFVRCLTFNHEAYIEDALNGFVMQQTNFPFVVTIVNDASPDNTKNVIEKFITNLCESSNIIHEQTSYADIIKATPKENPNCLLFILNLYENHFLKKSHRPYYQEYVDKAKYWAECEGDDYWIDPLKLQKQVDFLEANPECTCYAHNSLMLNTKTHEIGLFNDKLLCMHDYTLEQFITRDWFTPTQSLLFRKDAYNTFEDLPSFMHGDYSILLNILLRDGSYLHYENEIMSVYRSGGWASTHYKEQDLYRDFISLLSYYKDKSNHRCDEVFDKQINRQRQGLKQSNMYQRDIRQSRSLHVRIWHYLSRLCARIANVCGRYIYVEKRVCTPELPNIEPLR